MTGKERKAQARVDPKFAAGDPDGALSRENRSRDFVAKLVHDTITDAMQLKPNPRTGNTSNGATRVTRPGGL